MPRNTILGGDALTRLRSLPEHSVHCVVTSPPYFRLRDYSVSGQLGQEQNVDEWVEHLAAVCAEIARVLVPTGGLWLNLGDGYSRSPRVGAPKKSLICAPERLLLRLLTDGWILRNKVIWAKTNPMPQSANDRLSPTHEVVFFLIRSPHYFFDLDRIRIPLASAGRPAPRHPRPLPTENSGLAQLKALGRSGHRLGRNPGDVWTLGKPGFRGEHSATFPPGLIERPILASCPERVCTACGAGWRRPVIRAATASRPATLGRLRGCACKKRLVPGLVLDPFFGTGTVGEVAARHGRDWLGIELNPVYRGLARKRLGMLAPFGSPNNRGTVETDGSASSPARPIHRHTPQGPRPADAAVRRCGRRQQERRLGLGARQDGPEGRQAGATGRRAGGKP